MDEAAFNAQRDAAYLPDADPELKATFILNCLLREQRRGNRPDLKQRISIQLYKIRNIRWQKADKIIANNPELAARNAVLSEAYDNEVELNAVSEIRSHVAYNAYHTFRAEVENKYLPKIYRDF
jgi:hypothetical protein